MVTTRTAEPAPAGSACKCGLAAVAVVRVRYLVGRTPRVREKRFARCAACLKLFFAHAKDKG